MIPQWIKALPDERKQQLRAIGRVALSVLPHRHNLSLLAVKHGGDKLRSGYIPHYQRMFGPMRKRRMTVLEIGIGGWDDPNAGGESLRMWRDYFPNSEIVGIDIADKRGLDGPRLRTFRGDQSDPAFLGDLVRTIGQPDIVIDDGSHRSAHIRASFAFLFPHLRMGGIYVIEDLYTSYWIRSGGNWQDGMERETSVALLKSLIDSIHYPYIPFRDATPLDRSIVSLHVFRKIAFVSKGESIVDDAQHIDAEFAAEIRGLERARATGVPHREAHDAMQGTHAGTQNLKSS